jgi:hypothetical protein
VLAHPRAVGPKRQESNTLMSSTKYIGMDVHTECISIAVRNSIGKLVMECVIETKASAILEFIDGLRGDLRARKLSEQLYMNNVKSVYHGEHGLRMLKELARSYLTISKDLTRVMNRLKALYRSWGIPCAGKKCMPYGTVQNGSRRSAKPGCGDAPNITNALIL